MKGAQAADRAVLGTLPDGPPWPTLAHSRARSQLQHHPAAMYASAPSTRPGARAWDSRERVQAHRFPWSLAGASGRGLDGCPGDGHWGEVYGAPYGGQYEGNMPPYTWPYGHGRAAPGWAEGLEGTCEGAPGGRREVVSAPSRLWRAVKAGLGFGGASRRARSSSPAGRLPRRGAPADRGYGSDGEPCDWDNPDPGAGLGRLRVQSLVGRVKAG